MSLETIIAAVLPSVLVGIIMAYYNKKQAKRDKEIEQRAKDRRKESLLGLKLSMANGKMSYATAMAIKRGHANGEVEEGIEAYSQARKEYLDFVNEQAVEHLNKK
jgi:hypothetical protein